MRKITNNNVRKDVILEFLENKRPSCTGYLVQIKLLYLLLYFSCQVVPYGLAARIPGFHPGGPRV